MVGNNFYACIERGYHIGAEHFGVTWQNGVDLAAHVDDKFCRAGLITRIQNNVVFAEARASVFAESFRVIQRQGLVNIGGNSPVKRVRHFASVGVPLQLIQCALANHE